jgi:MerR family mercuric resistance operon transcriptional regulator
MTEKMTRGELARRCGVNFETIRYYEQRGLLARPRRSTSNYRLYSDEAVRRIRFIRQAQTLGFTLKEIRELLSLRARPGARCADVRARAEAKMKDIDAKVRTLRSMRKSLARLIADCSGRGPVTVCSILGNLDAPEGGA